MDLCASKMKTLKPIFSSLFTKKGFLAKEPQYQSSSCNRIIRLGHLGTSSFVLSFTHNVFAREIRNFFRFPGKCDLLCNSHNIMHVLVRPIRNKDSVCGAPTSLQVVMAVYQMHQAASLDLVSLAVFFYLAQILGLILSPLKGLDVGFFVLCRSALSTLGEKRRPSAVKSGITRDLPAISNLSARFPFSEVDLSWPHLIPMR